MPLIQNVGIDGSHQLSSLVSVRLNAVIDGALLLSPSGCSMCGHSHGHLALSVPCWQNICYHGLLQVISILGLVRGVGYRKYIREGDQVLKPYLS